MRKEIELIFKTGAGLERIYFPERSNDIPDRPVLTLVVVAPDVSVQEGNAAYQQLDAMTRDSGASACTFRNALIWGLPDGSGNLAEETPKVLAWEAIHAEQDLTDEAQKRQLLESLGRATRDLQASIWRSYRRLLLLGKDNALKIFDLGQMNASGGVLVSQIISQLQQRDELVDSVGAGFLVRNWPPAFTEWSTRMVRDAFFASPQLRRLLRADILKTTIAQGVTDGVFAYVGKTESGAYQPFFFKHPISASSVDISDEMFIITAETATAYLKRQEQQETLAAPGPMDDPGDEGEKGELIYTPVLPLMGTSGSSQIKEQILRRTRLSPQQRLRLEPSPGRAKFPLRSG